MSENQQGILRWLHIIELRACGSPRANCMSNSKLTPHRLMRTGLNELRSIMPNLRLQDSVGKKCPPLLFLHPTLALHFPRVVPLLVYMPPCPQNIVTADPIERMALCFCWGMRQNNVQWEKCDKGGWSITGLPGLSDWWLIHKKRS